MNIASKLFCRIFQGAFYIAIPFLPYREPKVHKKVSDILYILKKKNINSVLLVTDKHIYEMGITKELEKILKENHILCSVYHDTMPNPTTENVECARKQYIEDKCNALIAFGGGSSMDCAKAVGARIVYPKKSLEQLKGLLKVRKRIPTMIAIPTTAGTGSETTVTAVITDSQTRHKYTMNNFPFIPYYAVLDPEVTYSLPPSLTATTGMDALTHAVEAYIGRSTTKQTRRLAKEAVRLIFGNIETAYTDGHNYEARSSMLEASYKAGIAFSKSYVGYVHAVAHSLGGAYNIPHGLANAVILPIGLEIYGNTVHKKLHELGIVAGICNATDSHQMGAEKFIAAIKQLNHRMGIPETLSCLKKEDIQKLAKYAASEANPLYPVPKLMNAKELEVFYVRIADWSR